MVYIRGMHTDHALLKKLQDKTISNKFDFHQTSKAFNCLTVHRIWSDKTWVTKNFLEELKTCIISRSIVIGNYNWIIVKFVQKQCCLIIRLTSLYVILSFYNNRLIGSWAWVHSWYNLTPCFCASEMGIYIYI